MATGRLLRKMGGQRSRPEIWVRKRSSQVLLRGTEVESLFLWCCMTQDIYDLYWFVICNTINMMYASSFVLHFADFRDSHLAQTSVSIVPDGGSTHWSFAQFLGWKMDVSPVQVLEIWDHLSVSRDSGSKVFQLRFTFILFWKCVMAAEGCFGWMEEINDWNS